MSNISFIVNNNLANTFIKELYIGFNWDPQSVAVTLSTARYGNANQNFSITISINGGANLSDAFTFEQENSGSVPPNPIKLESSGIYKGLDCYAVVNWNAINDPSLANVDGVVTFNATIIRDTATVLDNSPTIKQFIYDHALDDLSRDAVTNYLFTRESWATTDDSDDIIPVGNYHELKTAIVQNNNAIISLTNDIAIEKDNDDNLSTEYNPNTQQGLNVLINLSNKNLIINGNGHKVYEKGNVFYATLNQDGTRYEAPFFGNVTGNEAFITIDGEIILLARSSVYRAKNWIVTGDNRFGIALPDQLVNLHLVDTENVFVCFRLNFQRIMKKIINATTGVIFFENTESYTINDLNAHTPETDFFLINYKGDGEGALIKNGKVSYPICYNTGQISQCWASHLIRVKNNSNVVFNNVVFNGGMDYSIRNDSKLKVNECHFTNSIGGGICNYLQLSVKGCHFSEIKTHAVRFDHVGSNYNDVDFPYMEVTESLFQNIGRYGSSSFALWSTGKAYIAYNEFIDTNYGAIRIGEDNCTSELSRHSENLVEWNYIHYTPEWIQERRLLGLQNSGAITIVTNNEKAIVRFNRIVGCGGPGKNIGIYGNNGAYNMEIYGNVISGTENFYDIDCWDVSPTFSGQTPNGSYNDVNTNNLIKYNIFDGYIRIQENSLLTTTGCNFFKNFKLEPNPKANNAPSEVSENIFNQMNDYRNGEGIMTDESGIVAAAYLSVLGNYEPIDS